MYDVCTIGMGEVCTIGMGDVCTNGMGEVVRLVCVMFFTNGMVCLYDWYDWCLYDWYGDVVRLIW